MQAVTELVELIRFLTKHLILLYLQGRLPSSQCQIEQLQKELESLSATTILAVCWSCHIQREVGEMNKAAQGIMQLIEAIGRGRNCPVNFSTALGIKSLY